MNQSGLMSIPVLENQILFWFFFNKDNLQNSNIINEIHLAKKYKKDIIIIKEPNIIIPNYLIKDIYYIMDKGNVSESLQLSMDYLVDSSYDKKQEILCGMVLLISALNSLIKYKQKIREDSNAF